MNEMKEIFLLLIVLVFPFFSLPVEENIQKKKRVFLTFFPIQQMIP